MRLLLGLVALMLGGAFAAAQPVGCAPNSANYPCVYVANSNDGTVSVINAITKTVIATDTVAVGLSPEGVAVTPNNASVYVANSGGGTVSVIDTATNTVVATVQMQNFPFQIAITPDGAFAYVTEFEEDPAPKHEHRGAGAHVSRRSKPLATGPAFVEVIDTATNTIVGSIANLNAPSAVAISPNGANAYVADQCGPNENPCVEVVSTSNNQIVTTVPIPAATPFSEGSIAVTPDGSLVCVAVGVNNGDFTDLAIAFITTSNNTLLAPLLDTQTVSGISFYGFATTPSGSLYAAAFNPDGVYLINPASQKLVETIQAGAGPQGAALSPDGASVYVTDAGAVGAIDDTVSVINTKTNTVTSTITVGNDPQGVAGMQVPTATLSSTSLNFGNQPVGTTSASQQVSITNTGTATLAISSISITGTNSGDFAATPCALPAQVLPGASCNIQIDFTPTASGTRNATLSITDDAAGSPQVVSLTGVGTATAAVLSPAPLNFGSTTQPQLVGTSASLPVTLTNSGSAPLTITSIGFAGTNASEFTQNNNCGTALKPDSSCTINVTFTPTANGGSGSATASLSVADNAAGSPQTVPITGTVRNFALTTTCTSLNVVPGQTAIFTVDLAPVNGFAQSVSLSCSGAPALATCTVSPNPIALDGSTTVQAKVTATTTRATGLLRSPFGRSDGNRMAGLAGLTGIAGLAGLIVLPGKRGVKPRRRACGLIFLLCMLAILVMLPSCGGGGDPPGTAAGTYPLTVTGTFQSATETAITESVSFNLAVK
jgi:YVTN family beta-propeller protein